MKIDHETIIEWEKIEIERKKFELEKLKFDHAQIIDEQKLKTERLTKLWTQFSIFIPLVILITGFFLTSYSEQVKRNQTQTEERGKQERTQKQEMSKMKRQFIEKQLAEFYYPIQLRLDKDNGFFETWRKQMLSGNIKIGNKIEEVFILPNQDEILKIIDSHFELIKNDSETDEKVHPLKAQIKLYQIQFATYKSLRDTGDSRKPNQLNVKFPEGIIAIIDKRIADLEAQRDALLPQ